MKRYFFIFLALLCASVSFSQEKQGVSDDFESPKLVVKTNALFWLTTTPNLSVETSLSDKMSLDVLACWNPWKFSEGARFQVFVIQPEVRYWLGQSMKGHFVGFHTHYVRANVGLIDATVIGTPLNFHLAFLPRERKEGNIYGFGASYGYSWLLSSKWRLEGVVSLGYAHMQYATYAKNGWRLAARDYYNYVGPTKLGINFIYVIK
jgi:hypothetical protein